MHGWKFSVFWLISVFLAKVQTVLEIHVNLMSFFQGVRYAFLTKEIKIFERILICVNSKKNSVFVKKFTFTHVDAMVNVRYILLQGRNKCTRCWWKHLQRKNGSSGGKTAINDPGHSGKKLIENMLMWSP